MSNLLISIGRKFIFINYILIFFICIYSISKIGLENNILVITICFIFAIIISFAFKHKKKVYIIFILLMMLSVWNIFMIPANFKANHISINKSRTQFLHTVIIDEIQPGIKLFSFSQLYLANKELQTYDTDPLAVNKTEAYFTLAKITLNSQQYELSTKQMNYLLSEKIEYLSISYNNEYNMVFFLNADPYEKNKIYCLRYGKHIQIYINEPTYNKIKSM